MKAMILAAGLGTRLRPLTNDRPKALVEVGGRTMLEIALARLHAFGIREVIVNTHHFAGMVEEWLRQHGPRDMRIEISHEDVLLDTGGGLKHAAWFFQEPGTEAGEPFLLHNVDVVSTIDFARMLRAHRAGGALATLAVQDRPTSRPLFFDQKGELCGRRAGPNGPPEFVRLVAGPLALAFSGIHVISPRIFSLLGEERAFSIIPAYLRQAVWGESIAAFRAEEYYWRDLGRPEHIEQAARDIGAGMYPW
jgi:NDP-sugar pyrophosphorylase family protein